MRFGLFGGASASEIDGPRDSQVYGDFVDYVCEAESLGFESVFLVEHHFTGLQQVSASLSLLCYLAAKTGRMRLGTAVTVLTWHNPALLAEQAAALDLLSGGRLDFGVGRGYRENEFAGFCIPRDEAGERYEEALEIIRKAWTSRDRFSHEGKFWRFRDIVVEPAPVQRPHPPLWIGAGNPATIETAAQGGFNLLLDQLASFETSAGRARVYRDAVEAAGRSYQPHSVGLTRALHMTFNDEERERAYEMRAKFLLSVQALATSRHASSLALPSNMDELRASTEAAALIGPPGEIIARLKRLEADGIDFVLIMDVSWSRETLRIFGNEILPEFRDAAPGLKTVKAGG